MEIRGTTRVFALLGNPVEHSLSPAMHNAAFRILGIDAAYVPLRCEAADVSGLMRALARAGGGGNVTVPHKEAAALALGAGESGEPALPICNTFWGVDGALRGAETDSAGIGAVLLALGAAATGWCLVGTGGSARAALRAAVRAGAAVSVRSRSPERAAALVREARTLGLSIIPERGCAVAINCTPLGLGPADPLPVEPAALPDAEFALDLVYRPGETRWVQAFRAAGRRAADGREVLVQQGAAAFELWFPGRSAPREVMRAAVRAALG